MGLLRVKTPCGCGALVTRVAALLVAAALPVIYWVRLRHAGVSIGDETVRIVNVLRTHEIPVAEIDSFTVGPGRFFPRIGKVVRRNGSPIHVWAIQSTLNQHVRAGDRGAHDVVDDLNDALGLRRSEAA